LKEEETARM